MPEQVAKQTHIIDFVKTRDYRVFEIHGAWGGVTSQGEVQLDLYVDKGKLPERLVQELNEEGHVVHEEKTPPLAITERVVQFGCLMSASVARQLGEFLMKQAASVERVNDPHNNDWPNIRAK